MVGMKAATMVEKLAVMKVGQKVVRWVVKLVERWDLRTAASLVARRVGLSAVVMVEKWAALTVAM